MKVSILLSAVLVVAVTAGTTHERRQDDIRGGIFTSVASSAKKPVKSAVKTQKLKPELFPNAIREKVTWGPFTVNNAAEQAKAARGPGLKLDAQSDMIESPISGLCQDCIVLRANAEITDKEGNRLGLKNDIYIHHIIVVDRARNLNMAPLSPANSSCKAPAGAGIGTVGSMAQSKGGDSGNSMAGMSHGGSMGGMSHGGRMKRDLESLKKKRQGGSFSIMLAKGNEGDQSVFASVGSAVKSGYWIGAKDPILALAEIVNYKSVPQDVYLTVDMEYTQFNTSVRPTEYLDVNFGTIQVGQCNSGISLHPAKDKVTTYKSADYVSHANGYIVGLTPHLHDGAIDMNILVNDKVSCESKALYGKDDGAIAIDGQKWETITAYEPCQPVQIKKGDKVKISANYDPRQHRLRPQVGDDHGEAEAMAIALFQFARE